MIDFEEVFVNFCFGVLCKPGPVALFINPDEENLSGEEVAPSSLCLQQNPYAVPLMKSYCLKRKMYSFDIFNIFPYCQSAEQVCSRHNPID